LFLLGYGWSVGELLHEHWLRCLLSGLYLIAIRGVVAGINLPFHDQAPGDA
jgi:hypothetical protein